MLDITQLIQIWIIVIVSIGLHEYAHAYVSSILGDPTPKLQGRLTPNPLKHIDIIGLLMILSPLHFGWGKPVQINPSYYKHPRRDELMVALAGPATNLVLALSWVLLLVIYSLMAWYKINVLFNQGDLFTNFWVYFAQLNIWMAVFNLIPIPPLDGFRLIKMFFWNWGKQIERYSLYIWLGFLFLFMGPGSSIFSFIIWWASDWILRLFFSIFGQVFY